MRMLRLFLVCLLSADLLLCLVPAFTVGIGQVLDNVLNLRNLSFGPANLIVASLLIGFGLFWVAWSWYGLLTVDKVHRQAAFGMSLAASTVKLVATGLFKYTHNPMFVG